MRTPLAFLRFVAKAVLNAVGFGVAGDLTVEVLPEVARDVWDWWGKGHRPTELRDEVQAIAQLSADQAQQLAAQAVAQEAAGQPGQKQAAVVSYLTRLPAAIRASQRRPADPTGRTVSPSLPLSQPEHLIPLLPRGGSRFQPGQRVPGFADWTLEELLGVGGFGEVWKAVNPGMPPVAVKFCLDAAAMETLKNEKALLGRIKAEGTHPGIVRLENTSLLGDPPCLMYEYVAGGDLTRLMHDWHSTPRADLADQVVRLMRQLARIIAFAHRLKPAPIIHRDLKPANILLQPTAKGVTLRVADFGIGGIVSKQAVAQSQRGTTRGAFLATALRGTYTPLYASPEQMRGADPDPRDDVHALGVIWYQMLLGDLSVGAPTGRKWPALLQQRGVSEPMIDVLGSCFEAAVDRPADAGVLLADLERVLGGAGVVEVIETEQAQTKPKPDGWLTQPPPSREPSARKAAPLPRRVSEKEERSPPSQGEHPMWQVPPRPIPAPAPLRKEQPFAPPKREPALTPLNQSDRLGATPQTDNSLAENRKAPCDRPVPLDDGRPKTIGAVMWLATAAVLFLGCSGLLWWLRSVPAKSWDKEITNSIGMKLVRIPPGTFTMGSPTESGRGNDERQHEVKITKEFWLGVHKVTQAQWRAVMGNNPSWFCASGGGNDKVKGMNTDDFPVECVSWQDAQDFLKKLNTLKREQEAGRKYRLPTEAEWEFSCRGGSVSYQVFHFGNSLSSTQANFDGRSPYGGAAPGPYLQRTCKVGSYPPNAFGLFDMHGNAREWCSDWYDQTYYDKSPPADPPGPSAGSSRVVRGGSWHLFGHHCRSALRNSLSPSERYDFLGFRVAAVSAAR